MNRLSLFIITAVLLLIPGAEPLFAGPDQMPPFEGQGRFMMPPEGGMFPGGFMAPPGQEMTPAESDRQGQDPSSSTAAPPVETTDAAAETEASAEAAPAEETPVSAEAEAPAEQEPNAAQMPVPSLSPSGSNSESLTGYARYQIISQQNMFSRQRRPLMERQPMRPRNNTMRRVVISLYVLRGISEQGDQKISTQNDRKIAHVEDTIGGETLRLSAGSTLLDGTIKEIYIDHVVFDENGQMRNVKVGETFGQVESGGTPISSPSTAADTASAESPVDADAAENTADTGTDENAVTAVTSVAPADPNRIAQPKTQEELLREMMERRNRELR